MSKKDTDFVQLVGRLMAGRAEERPAGRKLVRKFYTRRTKKEIRAIIKKVESLGYGEQTAYLKDIGAKRSNLQYWRMLVMKWNRHV